MMSDKNNLPISSAFSYWTGLSPLSSLTLFIVLKNKDGNGLKSLKSFFDLRDNSNDIWKYLEHILDPTRVTFNYLTLFRLLYSELSIEKDGKNLLNREGLFLSFKSTYLT